MKEAPSPNPLPKGEGFHAVHVRTPCRLHFGMFSFGHADRPEFGGVGAMIEPPNVEITIAASDGFSARGAHSGRVRQFVAAATRSWDLPSLPNCQIDVSSPADHTGLGVGTQLGLATAAGLRRFLLLPDLPAPALAAAVGRGQRSAVGTYGFQLGGLIVDAGKTRGGQLGSLGSRVELPGAWRIVLVNSMESPGLAGDREAEAFANLPLVPVSMTHELWRITNEQMLPAAARADCTEFGEAVYQFGRLAGECFATVQGGPFASPLIERLVASIRDHGLTGVGQSSWGPTVFAITENDSAAKRLANWMHGSDAFRECEISIARPNNTGALIADYPRTS
jgi:beta-ribofuranosylaminobenzene 5'-phosphate synthase